MKSLSSNRGLLQDRLLDVLADKVVGNGQAWLKTIKTTKCERWTHIGGQAGDNWLNAERLYTLNQKNCTTVNHK